VSNAGGAADNHGGLALQIKMEALMEGLVSFRGSVVWFDRRYGKRYIESISKRPAGEYGRCAGEKKWLPKKYSGSTPKTMSS
jgi:hypothetical protein